MRTEPFPQPIIYKQQKPRRRPIVLAAWVIVGILGSSVGVSGWQAFAFRLGTELAAVQATESMGNLQRLQHELGNGKTNVSDKLISQGDMPYTLESIKRDLHDPVGRSDPFSPLVKPVVATPTGTLGALPPPKRDILLDLQYTGFIGDSNSRNKVAVIRVSDPVAGNKTLIKKAGESFTIEGQRAVLTSISTSGITVRLSGETRSLSMQPYQEIPVSDPSGNPAGNALIPATLGQASGLPTLPAASLPGVPATFMPPTGSSEMPRGR